MIYKVSFLSKIYLECSTVLLTETSFSIFSWDPTSDLFPRPNFTPQIKHISRSILDLQYKHLKRDEEQYMKN